MDNITEIPSTIQSTLKFTPSPEADFSQTPPADSIIPSKTSTPVLMLTATLTSTPIYNPKATKTNEHVYIDPEGWYSVNIPVDWQPSETLNSFSGDDGFFETGYLPDMMYLDQPLDVCQWLANIETKNRYSVYWPSNIGNGCQLISHPSIAPDTVLEVIKNPSADYPQRYFYIKTDAEHHDQIAATFSWLRPIGKNSNQNFQTLPIRPDDISFWENTSPLPTGFSITEYELPEEAQNESPGEKVFLKFIPREALPEVTKSDGIYSPISMESINESIIPFGYQMQIGAESYLYDLYKDGELAVKNIHRLPDIYVDSTGETENVAFIVHTTKDINKSFYAEGNAASYLIQTDSIRLWAEKPPNPMLTWGRAQWVSDELLIMGLGDHTDVEVRNSKHVLIFSFETYFGASIPFKQFTSWDNHWILGVSDFIVQDGEILNEKHGFEEVYNWYLINNKPLYFFRKGPRSGISYDGKFLSIFYHEIVHGYCCGLALNNPRVYENSIRFFGRRDGIWYYVVIEIK